MKKPSRADGERCIEVRRRSKRGEHVSPADLRWLGKMCDRYPDWYDVTQARVFNETTPFGSNVIREVSPEAYSYDD